MPAATREYARCSTAAERIPSSVVERLACGRVTTHKSSIDIRYLITTNSANLDRDFRVGVLTPMVTTNSRLGSIQAGRELRQPTIKRPRAFGTRSLHSALFAGPFHAAGKAAGGVFRCYLRPDDAPVVCYDKARSKRSRFMTLFHAVTKSCTNFSRESSDA